MPLGSVDVGGTDEERKNRSAGGALVVKEEKDTDADEHDQNGNSGGIKQEHDADEEEDENNSSSSSSDSDGSDENDDDDDYENQVWDWEPIGESRKILVDGETWYECDGLSLVNTKGVEKTVKKLHSYIIHIEGGGDAAMAISRVRYNDDDAALIDGYWYYFLADVPQRLITQARKNGYFFTQSRQHVLFSFHHDAIQPTCVRKKMKMYFPHSEAKEPNKHLKSKEYVCSFVYQPQESSVDESIWCIRDMDYKRSYRIFLEEVFKHSKSYPYPLYPKPPRIGPVAGKQSEKSLKSRLHDAGHSEDGAVKREAGGSSNTHSAQSSTSTSTGKKAGASTVSDGGRKRKTVEEEKRGVNSSSFKSQQKLDGAKGRAEMKHDRVDEDAGAEDEDDVEEEEERVSKRRRNPSSSSSSSLPTSKKYRIPARVMDSDGSTDVDDEDYHQDDASDGDDFIVEKTQNKGHQRNESSSAVASRIAVGMTASSSKSATSNPKGTLTSSSSSKSSNIAASNGSSSISSTSARASAKPDKAYAVENKSKLLKPAVRTSTASSNGVDTKKFAVSSAANKASGDRATSSLQQSRPAAASLPMATAVLNASADRSAARIAALRASEAWNVPSISAVSLIFSKALAACSAGV